MRFLLLAILAAGFISATPATAAQSLQELGRESLGFYPAMAGPYAIADFDHDGIDDIVLPGGAGQDTLLQVYGRRNGAYASKQMLVVPYYATARVLVHVKSGAPHLYVLTQDGNVYDYAGWPLQLRPAAVRRPRRRADREAPLRPRSG